ncbi:MAG: CBS domain-containing protein [Dehalococcoidia bacterium]|nr:CBS domain-containing protein [Dehalococcoidia bacterium]
MTDNSSIRVRDLMSEELFTVDGLATVDDAMALMKRHRVGSLVVNRRNEDDELGLIAVGDIARRVIAEDRSPKRVNVYEIMAKPLLTLPEDMLAKYASRLLARFNLSRAVVVDRDRNPLGMVTLRDLIMGYTSD